jgi:hypothetical protein
VTFSVSVVVKNRRSSTAITQRILLALLLLLGCRSFGQTECSDGTTSDAQHHQGACSHHGGIAAIGSGNDSSVYASKSPDAEPKPLRVPKYQYPGYGPDWGSKHPYRHHYCSPTVLGPVCGAGSGHFATQQELAALAHTQRDSRGRIKRSPHARTEFEREHPCPSTNAISGSCPGYVVDHVIPLACDGPDNPFNMQWQTTEQSKAKDKWERSMCGK